LRYEKSRSNSLEEKRAKAHQRVPENERMARSRANLLKRLKRRKEGGGKRIIHSEGYEDETIAIRRGRTSCLCGEKRRFWRRLIIGETTPGCKLSGRAFFCRRTLDSPGGEGEKQLGRKDQTLFGQERTPNLKGKSFSIS